MAEVAEFVFTWARSASISACAFSNAARNSAESRRLRQLARHPMCPQGFR